MDKTCSDCKYYDINSWGWESCSHSNGLYLSLNPSREICDSFIEDTE